MSLAEGLEEEKVECCGSVVFAPKDHRGFYVCPICKEAVFFTPHDLMRHLIAHALGVLSRRHKVPRRQ